MTTDVLTASAFLSTLGVDTHIPYTDGGYVNLANDEADLKYLGITIVRDGISNGANGSAPLSSYITLAQEGIKFTFCISGGGTNTTATMDATLSLIDSLQKAVPGSVAAVEGVNEVNNSNPTYNGVGGLPGAVAMQEALYSAVHSDPVLQGVAVDYFTGYNAGAIPVGPDPLTTPGLADYDTQHPYPNYGQAPSFWVSPAQALGNETGQVGPAVYTETGYSTNGGTSGAVNADVQAKYTLDLLMDDAKNGISQTFLYQLMDAYQPGSSQGDDGFGLFDPSSAPKEAATAIHNLTSILADSGANTATTGSSVIDYGISGLPSTGSSLQLTRSDGSHDIIVWNEPQIWNESTGTETAVAATPATLQLGADYQSVVVYDPLVSSAPIATFSNVSSVELSITDHPLIVEVGAALTPVAAVPTPAPVVTPQPSSGTVILGSGADTVALNISEDAYQGNAQFTVSVDGLQIGGTQTATVLKSSGATQTFDVEGNFGVGSHTVAVDFLNDAYGGSAATDRNLYVQSATIDGSAVPGAALSLLSGGTQSFTFTGPAPAPAAASSAAVTIGSGSDTLALQVAEDAWQGNAQFTVSVDGVQIGGTQTATALQSSGKTQTFDVLGSFAAGSHTVAVDFLNDAYGGSAATDRNLYVDSATLNGTAVPGCALSLLSGGTQSFNFSKPAATAASSTASSTSPVTIGSGTDGFTLGISEDAWQGNAQYTVSVDGDQVGGTQTATALHSAGAIQTLTVNGNWGTGTHTVGVSFINDAYGGSATTDRNLYVSDVSYDATAATPGSATLLSNGTASFSATSLPTGVVTLLLAEDAYKGNAQYTATVDGTQVSSGAVTALNSAGQSQAITLPGTLSAGTHQLGISFTNDLYAGSPTTDRNLYVKGVELNGTVISGSAATLYSSGTDTLSIVVPQHSAW